MQSIYIEFRVFVEVKVLEVVIIEEGLGRVWNDDDGTFTILNEVTAYIDIFKERSQVPTRAPWILS